MRVSVIQTNISWANKAANLKATAAKLETLQDKTDLVVLPEMFTTGFCTDLPELAESMEGETVQLLQKWALQFKMAIAGSFIAKEHNKNFNRGFIVLPTGNIQYADKRHLFSMGGENLFFNAGNQRLIVKYLDMTICLLICYDLRFPVWARNVQNQYDLLIFVANFPAKRIQNWDILLQARSIENQCYICGVNRIGSDAKGINYNGHSVILDYNAKQILTTDENKESINTIEIELKTLQEFREKMAFWKDADSFKLL
ncbi:MAG: nitrilase family protein [Porphyromonadaceae bacterium CG2_30_38_12]|nr:MAG: nitrilase family protein [Porphyromonadaceae bacterium CG2_30_38_12]